MTSVKQILAEAGVIDSKSSAKPTESVERVVRLSAVRKDWVYLLFIILIALFGLWVIKWVIQFKSIPPIGPLFFITIVIGVITVIFTILSSGNIAREDFIAIAILSVIVVGLGVYVPVLLPPELQSAAMSIKADPMSIVRDGMSIMGIG